MKPIELEVLIHATAQSVFATMTEPARMARWLPQTEAIEDRSGPIGVTGATFTQRGAPGVRRPGATIAADPPRSLHLRMAGYGERVDVRFRLEEDSGGSTRVQLQAHIENGPAILAPIVNRLSVGLDRKLWNGALARLKSEVERRPAVVQRGRLYSLDARAGTVRIAQVLAADDQHVHLRLDAQRFPKRPAREDLAELRLRTPGHYAEIRPLPPTLRGAMRGGPAVGWLLADGGFGMPHLPVSRAAFDDTEPEGMFDAGVDEAHLAPVEAWRIRGGHAFGEALEPTVGAFLSVVLDGGSFGIVKLLRTEFRGVHVRLYSDVLTERPAAINEMALGSGSVATARLGVGWPPGVSTSIGHLPLSHPSFTRWSPQIVSLALVEPEELVGYEEWKLAKGGFF